MNATIVRAVRAAAPWLLTAVAVVLALRLRVLARRADPAQIDADVARRTASIAFSEQDYAWAVYRGTEPAVSGFPFFVWAGYACLRSTGPIREVHEFSTWARNAREARDLAHDFLAGAGQLDHEPDDDEQPYPF